MRNRLEMYFTRYLKKQKNTYYMKLQVSEYAHKSTVADYLVLCNKYNLAVECKMSQGKAFNFSRLTQERDLIDFERALRRNRSYLLLMFWRGRCKSSILYLIPIHAYLEVKNKIGKKSMNIGDCAEYLSDYRFTFDRELQMQINK